MLTVKLLGMLSMCSHPDSIVGVNRNLPNSLIPAAQLTVELRWGYSAYRWLDLTTVLYPDWSTDLCTAPHRTAPYRKTNIDSCDGIVGYA